MRQNGPQRRGRGRPSGRRGNNNSPNRSYDSSGPDVKIRGTASTVYEKYSALARDAIVSGDRVAAENFYQHAEHYYRVMQTTRQQRQGGDGEQPENRNRTQPNRDDRNNENGSETGEDKAVLTEDANVAAETETSAPDSARADKIATIGVESTPANQEEGSAAPMNPAELAAMSGSGRKTGNTQNTNGQEGSVVSDTEPAPRRQPRRRRAAPAPKPDLREIDLKEPESADSAAKEEAE